jgi:hypothetical protein
VRRATAAEARLDGERCDRDLIPEAARLAATSIKADDARSSAICAASVLRMPCISSLNS